MAAFQPFKANRGALCFMCKTHTVVNPSEVWEIVSALGFFFLALLPPSGRFQKDMLKYLLYHFFFCSFCYLIVVIQQDLPTIPFYHLGINCFV